MKHFLVTEEPLTKNTIEEDSKEKMIHLWGGSISEAAFDLDCEFFKVPHIPGFIAYRINSNCAVTFGDPICPTHLRQDLAKSFSLFCIEKGYQYIFISASKEFSEWALHNICNIKIEVGEEINFDPFNNPQEGPKGNRLRNKIHHAQHIGLTVHEYITENIDLEKEILEVGKEWLKGRKGPQIYLGSLNFFKDKIDKRWFYVKDKDQHVIGMALLSRLDLHQGWLIKFLVTIPKAPRGASELLMITILDILKKENCHFCTYGMIPLESLGEITGLGSISKWIIKRFFTLAKIIFHLEQRKLYWQKFQPTTTPTYILFSSPRIGFKEIKALMNALKVDLQ